MPLHCISDGDNIYSHRLDDLAWAEIRRRHKKEHHLRFPCCSAIAVPKVSSRGTRFFAHYHKPENCTYGPESALHLLAKQQVAIAAQLAGWEAKTECRLDSGHTADVLAERGQESVVFEIQLQQQNDEATCSRHEIYRAGARKCVWLFRQRRFVSNMKVPSFNIRYDADRFVIGIPPQVSNSAPRQWAEEFELKEFVNGVLSGRLNWSVPVGGEILIPLRMYGIIGACPQCKRNDRLLSSVQMLLPESEQDPVPIWFWDTHPKIMERIEERYFSFRVGKLKERFNPSTGELFLTNGCRTCGAEIPNWIVRECANHNPRAGEYFGETSITLDAEFVSRLRGHEQIQRWKIT